MKSHGVVAHPRRRQIGVAALDGFDHAVCRGVELQTYCDTSAGPGRTGDRVATLDGDVRTQHGAYGISQSLYLIDPDGYSVEPKAR